MGDAIGKIIEELVELFKRNYNANCNNKLDTPW